MQANSSMILLDESNQWNEDARLIAHWSKLNVFPHQESIPQKVEEQALQIKSDYLAWVYGLGRYKVDNQTLTSHLKLFKNLSFWWMTKIAAKSPFRSPGIYQVFKLRAFEQLYFERGCEGLIYCGDNQILHQIFQNWCQKIDHPYKRVSDKKCHTKSEWTGIKRLISCLPFWSQALLYLARNWFTRYRHIRPGNSNKKQNSSKNQVTLVTYFPNIDIEKAKEGRFWSHYWEHLHDLLDNLPYQINWVWLYSKSDQINYADSVFLRDQCNRTSPEKHQHFLLEEFLTPQSFFESLKLYLKIYFRGLRLNKAQKAFCFQDSELNFFPVMEHDWKSSLFGKDAMEGVLFCLLFDSMAEILPANPWGLYIWENQPWERALITAWKRHQSEAKIAAHQQSTMRFLELRLFCDPRVYRETEGEAAPLPDKLCLNGSVALSLMKESQYPNQKIARIEALRYKSLAGRYGSEEKKKKLSGQTLLVVTGSIDRETQFQLKLLDEAAAMGGLKNYEKIIIKSHPDLPTDSLLSILKPRFQYTLVSQPLNKLWSATDVIYCSNSTTAPIEAGYLGIPAIITGPENCFNLNPLYGLSSVNYVTSSKMLCKELENPTEIHIPEDYFYLDNKMTLWKNLLLDEKVE